jgi:uncharacterized protein with PIN domain
MHATAPGHISSRRLVDFMLNGFSLTEQEHDHLVRCSICQREMTDATSAEINLPQPPEGQAGHVLRIRLADHLLNQSALTDKENEHLARCSTCQQEMVEAARESWDPTDKKDA